MRKITSSGLSIQALLKSTLDSTLFGQSWVILQRGCSYWLLCKGRYACTSPEMVKGRYNGEHPTRKSCSSSINSNCIYGKEQKKGDRHVQTTVHEPSSRALQCLKTRQRYRAETGRGVGAELSSLVPQPPLWD